MCDSFNSDPESTRASASNNPVWQRLREEKTHKISGGLYHEMQIRLTYNSNHIEGSQLSEEQTRRIFETNTIGGTENLAVDDIIETANHFRAIDFCIDNAGIPLHEGLIKDLHRILKTGTSAEKLEWFRIGEYKLRPNVVSGMETTPPDEVHTEIAALLDAYLAKGSPTLDDIIDFHYRFECIHPFQDGNGRVGRLIAFKECLHHGLVPFIIEDHKKYYYYRGLKEYATTPGYLRDTCLDGQDTFRALLRLFDLNPDTPA